MPTYEGPTISRNDDMWDVSWTLLCNMAIVCVWGAGTFLEQYALAS